ncbi:exported hypothetical protein [uncultured Desulfobacterium sp.]|uniref:Protein BatD n=1 Tax=uncultured Desulfobacterium sp. TaxID=201089 RepID=A0A445MXI6_9BACT|nr:exported hypothetical protein [uncultured Desulfobacterium sp.]
MTRAVIKIGLLLILAYASLLCPHVLAGPFKATAVAERTDPFVGEPFVFQIQVEGSESPDQPDLSHVTDFIVEFKGGRQNSSRSVTIVNGRMMQDVREGYFFAYQLTPKREGRLIIPSINVTAEGRTTITNPVIINAQKAVESDDFKLTLKLSKDQCYVGEPVILTVTWYIGKDVNGFNFTLPLLNNKDLDFINPAFDTQSGKKLYRIPLGDGEVIGEKGRARVGQKEFATITFEKILIPKKSGEISIEPATVSCSALYGYERRRNMFDDDFFSDFFNDDFFGRARRGVYRTVVVSSNTLILNVSDLPLDGRPDNFAGHIGQYQITATATPTDVNVGDPITLTITLSGSDYLDSVKLPLLDQQPGLAKDFKIPNEMATGEVKGNTKVFTQTIRALRADVKEIPPIELSYFDIKSKSYGIARSEPIPLTVKETRMITAKDAEGRVQDVAQGSEIETWGQGIAFNYEDMGVIENQPLGPVSWFKSRWWATMVLFLPVLYILLLTIAVTIRRRNADPLKVRARKAYRSLTGSLKNAGRSSSPTESCNIILDAFRTYLGDRLFMNKGAVTFNDVKDKLLSEGVTQQALERLKTIFESCEAGRYAGGAGIQDAESMVEEGNKLAQELEDSLK